MNYDYIIIGSSIPCLLTATKIKDKRILIIEKDNHLGGAWRVDTDKYKNTDLVGHLIVPTNNEAGRKIINHFKKIDLNLKIIQQENLYAETDNFKKKGKQGDSIICVNGWTDFFHKIVNYVLGFDNIKIIKNTEILCIQFTKDNIELKNKDSTFLCKKLVIPMYCNLNKIYYDQYHVNIPYEKIINTHVILKILDNIILSQDYQAFLDKEPVGVFDRITVSKTFDNFQLLSCRISKKFKNTNKNKIENLYLPFLKEKNIVSDSCQIHDIYYYNYNCSYRGIDEQRQKIHKSSDIVNNYYNEKRLYILNTIYMGHFLENFVNDNLFDN